MAPSTSPTLPKPFKAVVSTLLLAASCLAVYLIFLISPSSKVLFPTFDHVHAHGKYPDGIPIEREYTGNATLDHILTGLAGFFSLAVDGQDEATRLFTMWFIAQLAGVLVFCFWESGRAGGTWGLVQLPTFVCIMAQLCTGAVTLPVYFLSHVLTMKVLPTALPRNALSRARTLSPVILLGFVAPSVALFLAPASVSLHTKQVIAAIWQPFPIYMTIIWFVLRNVDSTIFRTPSPATEARQTLIWLNLSYYGCAALCTAAHFAILWPSLASDDPATSFTHVFVPYYLHQYLPEPPSTDLPEWRIAVRLLFQHDWFVMTIAQLAFFTWHQYASRAIPMRAWLIRVAALTILGGPGTAVAWAAIQREKWIFAHTQQAQKKIQ